jgi:hypothetical protein
MWNKFKSLIRHLRVEKYQPGTHLNLNRVQVPPAGKNCLFVYDPIRSQLRSDIPSWKTM